MHDLFISYAHLDDGSPVGDERGWVTTFVLALTAALRQKLGRSDVDVWMDHSLAAGAQVTPELHARLRESRTLVLFLSPGYQNSLWCQRELGAFLEANQDTSHSGNVFIVEIEPVVRESWHPLLRDLKEVRLWQQELGGVWQRLGYPFPSLDERSLYWKRLNELAHFISAHLKRLPPPDSKAPNPAGTRAPVPQPFSPPPTGPTVWVAEPTGDLLDRWDDLVCSLRQAGCEIRPARTRAYDRRSEEAFLADLAHDLRASSLFVQLLSSSDADLEENRFALLQARAAREQADERGLRVLQWLPPGTRLEDLTDADYRQLASNVVTSNFEPFRSFVLNQAKEVADSPVGPPAPPRSPTTSGNRAFAICVNAHANDREMREQVQEALAGLGQETISTHAPESEQTPADYNAYLDQVIKESEGVVIVYGKCDPWWLRAQYTHARKVLAPVRSGLWGAIIEGPPKGKPPSGITSPNIMSLDCTDGAWVESLNRFVENLREARGA